MSGDTIRGRASICALAALDRVRAIAMFRAWMTHEHWVIWIAAAVVFILALAAIGYLSAPEYF